MKLWPSIEPHSLRVVVTVQAKPGKARPNPRTRGQFFQCPTRHHRMCTPGNCLHPLALFSYAPPTGHLQQPSHSDCCISPLPQLSVSDIPSPSGRSSLPRPPHTNENSKQPVGLLPVQERRQSFRKGRQAPRNRVQGPNTCLSFIERMDPTFIISGFLKVNAD